MSSRAWKRNALADTRTLEENLSALGLRQPSLAGAIRHAALDPRLVFLTARTGLTVPGVRSSSGTVPFHSLYDPRRESVRFAGSLEGAGCVVVSGLGGGYHVSAMLDDPAVGAVVVVEKDPGVLKTLLSHVRMQVLLQDPRLTIAAGVEMIRDAILAAWQPAIMGGLSAAPLRAWCDQERGFFDAASLEVQAAIDAAKNDFGVQSQFGKRWFANMLVNLAGAGPPPAALPRGNDAVVTAAGPSLDLQIDRLAAERAGRMLVATDTSLPALLRWGVVPDAVLSIDCQVHGYHHFFQGVPRITASFLDLASPPLLARRLRSPVFVASGHPFALYAASHWRGLPRIDMSGGNVTHAAVSLAVYLGARRVTVLGADFCYPQGKAYARGTYLYDYFWSDQGRMSPAEARFFAFVCGSGEGPARRGVRGGKAMYTTPLLDAYRDRFLRLVETIDAEVIAVPGAGQEIGRGTPRPSPPIAAPVSPAPGSPLAGAPGRSWRDFLSDYSRSLEELSFFSPSSSGPDRDLLHTLLPVAARVIKEGKAPGPGALEEARRWSLERTRRVLGAPGT